MSDKIPDYLPDHDRFDITDSAYYSRVGRLKLKLRKLGEFKVIDIVRIFDGTSREPSWLPEILVTTEKVAKRLRSEIHQIRKEQRITSKAPVLTGRTMSPVDIADIAISMLQHINQAPGPELIALLMELLNLDSHRRNLAYQPNEKKQKAAQLEAINPNLGVNELARKVDVANSTISRWKRDAFYKKMVQSATVNLKSFIPISPPDPPE